MNKQETADLLKKVWQEHKEPVGKKTIIVFTMPSGYTVESTEQFAKMVKEQLSDEHYKCLIVYDYSDREEIGISVINGTLESTDVMRDIDSQLDLLQSIDTMKGKMYLGIAILGALIATQYILFVVGVL